MNSVPCVLVVSVGCGGFSGGQNQIQTTCLHELGMCWLPVASLGVAVVKNLPAMQEMWVGSLNREDPWRMAWQPTPVFLPGKDKGAWGSAVHGVAKSWTRLSLNTHTQLSMTLRVTSTNKIVFFSPWK